MNSSRFLEFLTLYPKNASELGLGILRSIFVCVGLVFVGATVAWGDELLDVEVCLDKFDLQCALERRADLGGDDAVVVDRVSLWIDFHQGNYARAVQALDRLEASGVRVGELERGVPYRPTAEAAVGMVESRRDGVAVRVSQGPDIILVDEALEVMTGARRVIDQAFGGGPRHDIVLDIFPTASRFIAASGLPPESVQTTGVVALSKWTRLLLTSPRALGRGYGWKDTVAHEYIHLVVAYRTENRAPVWLQEGLAKHMETWWRGDRSGGLDAHTQSLLANALRDDSFVPFEKFARSMAYLDSGEEAALAFAQVSTMVAFMLESAGDSSLVDLMNRIRAGEDAQATVADIAGFADFTAFKAAWRSWLSVQPLIQTRLASLPVVLDGEGGDFDGDPLLAGRPDLARFARLGDLLRDRGYFEAALVEYEKAADPEEPPSPLLLARRAACLDGLGRVREALAVVDEGTRLYPEFTTLQKDRGLLLLKDGKSRAAIAAFEAAHDLNPYDPDVERHLAELHAEVGNGAKAARHQRVLRILATGGLDLGESPVDPG